MPTPTLSTNPILKTFGSPMVDTQGRSGNVAFDSTTGRSLAPAPVDQTPAATTGRSLSGTTGTASDLANSLDTGFTESPQYQSILDSYNSSRAATAVNTAATGQYIQNVTGGNTDYEKLQTGVLKQGELESRRGFATNVAALTNLQKQGDQRVKQLTDQANNALMANNAAGAAALSDLVVKEQTAMTDARTQFLNKYFSSQAEVRAQAEFQTPEQKQVLTLSSQYPDAGITIGDTLASAQQKISSGSAMYTAGLAQSQQTALSTAATAAATRQLAGAQSGLYGAEAGQAGATAASQAAQAAQTRTLTGFMGTPGNIPQTDPDVQYLLNGGTVEGLQARYAGTPQAVKVPQIIAAAQNYGYNQNNATLGYSAKAENAKNLGGGGFFGSMTAGTNLLGGFAQGAFGSNPLTPTTPTLNSIASPTKGQTTTLNGKLYRFDGANWTAIGNAPK